MIARLTVQRGTSTEYPLAEHVNGGWQNGATFYPDAEVTEVVELHVSRERGHGAEALATLRRIRGVDEATNQITLALEAKVQATLALVEQQRISNLISLMQMQAEVDEKTEYLAREAMHALVEYVRTPATPFSDPNDIAEMRPKIREALGLS